MGSDGVVLLAKLEEERRCGRRGTMPRVKGCKDPRMCAESTTYAVAVVDMFDKRGVCDGVRVESDVEAGSS
jgi:hypothetical protein